ncbi:VOC family protein [Rhodococcus sp. UNC363MFTsu5.1]|uniref:VOC family protein n=1 Tax=Rhodococcus sp. UNC363MFTsu5.1 TaxID=1449069 RepID=UPI000484A612|nr:VOC family protein [Rhodococcus sp. UNC363MFTsu5.1]
MDQHLSVLTLGVVDPARSHAFYVGGLGWMPTLYVEGEVLFLQVGPGIVLSLWSVDEMAREAGPTAPVAGEQGRAPITLGHNVGSQGEVDDVLATAARAGGTVLVAGARRAWGGYSGYFTDPDGYRWEIAYNPGLVVHEDGRVAFGEADPEGAG